MHGICKNLGIKTRLSIKLWYHNDLRACVFVRACVCACLYTLNKQCSSVQIDIRCVEPADGGNYYRDHLPLLGE